MENKALTQQGRKVPETKIKNIQEIEDLFSKNRTLMLVSTKNLPDKQLQSIKKDVRDKATIKVYKKSTLMRALEDLESVKEIENDVKENIAIVFSQEDPFKLALFFLENKSPVKAKSGQLIEEDVFVEPGPTEFVPGPIISELNNAKIKFGIENGKISIKVKSVIAKKGEAVTLEKASIMDKLGLKPFYIGLIPVTAYDKNSGVIYKNINFNKQEIINNMKEFSRKALGLAFSLGYCCKGTISALIGKAVSHEKALSKIAEEKSSTKEKPAEEIKEEDKKDVEIKEDSKTDSKVEEGNIEESIKESNQEENNQNKENTQGG
jgi:large subunit ribosomal protein L10